MPDTAEKRPLRNSLRCTLPEHDQAAELLSAAADAFLTGDDEQAWRRLREADFEILHRYGRLLMDRKDPTIAWPKRERTSRSPDAPRARQRMPSTSEEFALYTRDGWRCRYCGCRVIYKRAREILRKAFPDAIAWPASGPMHGGFFALTATADHIVPHARGGDNSPENLVTSCWPCNFGMEHDTLQDLGLNDPRLRPPVIDNWDGLTRLLAHGRANSASTAPKPTSQRKSARRDAKKHADEIPWLDRLPANRRPKAERFIQFLESCADIGVTWSAKEVLIAKMAVGANHVNFFGVEPQFAVQVPWSTTTPKQQLRRFADILAAGIPSAECHETPKLWNVSLPPDKTIPLEMLLDNTEAIRSALEALHQDLRGSPTAVSAT